MLTQIYEVSTPKEAEAVSAIGVDHIGILIGDGQFPREQPPTNAAQIGALGITHDWSISRRIVECVRAPIILAGGLGPDNVADAIRTVRPAGVDSKTKTDKDNSHAKDLERVRLFHEAAKVAFGHEQ